MEHLLADLPKLQTVPLQIISLLTNTESNDEQSDA